MNADINIVYTSDFYRIIDFKCKCNDNCKSKVEFSKTFNISFIRKGNFTYHVFRDSFDSYNGYAIIDKPGSEHIVEHNHHIPDECTIFDFTAEFYELIKEKNSKLVHSFFKNNDTQSVLVKTNAEIEFIHYYLLLQIQNKCFVKIDIDSLVIEMLEWFLGRIDNRIESQDLSKNLKKHHLQTIEEAKYFINNNYIEDVSLLDISNHCNISPFHFSRIFKKITKTSPYQFLLETRLKNAELLIRNSQMPIREICFASGFNSVEHFNAAFLQKFGHSPSVSKK